MQQYITMLGEAFTYAATGIMSRARAMVQVPGALLLWGWLWFLGYRLEVVDPVLGPVVVFVFSLAIVWGGVFTWRLFTWPWKELARARAKLRVSPLQIVYDPDDAQGRFVRPQATGSGNSIWHWIAVRNGSPDSKTLHDVTLRALECEFTAEVLALTHGQDGVRSPLLGAWDAIHPGATEILQLFAHHADPDNVRSEHVLGRPGRFTLEARAEDAQTATAEFEYNPSQRPSVWRVG